MRHGHWVQGFALGALVLGFAVLPACAADETTSGPGNGRGGNAGGASADPFQNATGGSSGAATGFGNSTAGAPSVAGMGAEAIPGGDPNDCGGDVYMAEGKTLEMYVLFDNSASWIFNNWPAAQMAFNSFINDPASAGIGVALKWYGESCDPATYATPDVPFGLLPMNGGAIASAVSAMAPTANTTTEPALVGGLQWANARYAMGVNARIVLLLITDGDPDPGDCEGSSYVNDIAAVSNVAKMGFEGNPSIPTYVLGVGDLPALNQVAAAGGTMMAISGAAGTLAATMNMIREKELAALPCEYDLPDMYPKFNDPDLVNLTFNANPVPRVQDAAGCAGAPDIGAWHYDNPTAPTRIVACDSTCGTFKSMGGAVNITLGCKTVVVE